MPETAARLVIETERETDGRWIAEVPALAGVLAYGATREEAIARAQALALRVLAERVERGEPTGELGGPVRSAAARIRTAARGETLWPASAAPPVRAWPAGG